jgi:hypothetical protein
VILEYMNGANKMKRYKTCFTSICKSMDAFLGGLFERVSVFLFYIFNLCFKFIDAFHRDVIYFPAKKTNTLTRITKN